MALSTSRPRRTTEHPVTYRDYSSEVETQSTVYKAPKRSSRRLRGPDENQSSDDGLPPTSQLLPAKKPSRRRINPGTTRPHRSRKRINYNEDEEEDSLGSESEATHHTAPATVNSQNHRKRSRPRQPICNPRAFSSFKRQKNNHPPNLSGVRKIKCVAAPAILQGRIPPWQTLPYQILLRICQYASYPLYRDASHDTGSIAWLTQLSTLSKSFHDAAIATLLYSPPLFPAYRAHGLQRLLDTPQDALSTVYRNKVKRLDVEVRHLLNKKGGIDLMALLKQTPVLDALHLYHNYDLVGAVYWAQPSASRGRNWSYPPELFEALDENHIRLLGWSWNGRFPDTKSVLDQMNTMHGRKCLEGLKSLSILNLAAPEKVKEDEQGISERSLTSSVDMLKDLLELKIQNAA